ncbi:MAG: tRNA (adenosine(37)-N6)-threonylcarbamoyltransferase complex dimerization subunit type 1 TsaB [Sphingomonas fennica]
MRLLAIETATAACSVALVEGSRCLAERHEIVGRGHAERLVPAIAEVVAEAGGAPPQAILVDCGPGSFTGVRVGLAAARALAFGWDVPVHGFSSLALIAAADGGTAETLAVAIPGGHGELFVQRFATAPFAAIGDLASLPPEGAAAALPDVRVIGGAAAAVVALRGTGDAFDAAPRAADVIRLPATFTALPPAPLYGRAPDAKAPAA